MVRVARTILGVCVLAVAPLGCTDTSSTGPDELDSDSYETEPGGDSLQEMCETAAENSPQTVEECLEFMDGFSDGMTGG